MPPQTHLCFATQLSMSSRNISQDVSSLPQEIVVLICNHLSRSDLKNARLVCHSWEAAARRILFREINLKVCIDSFDRLRNISTHAVLSKLVKFIHYDSRVLEQFDCRHNFDTWFHGSAGSPDNGYTRGLADGLRLSGEERRQFITQFTRADLEKAFRSYCQRLLKQELVLDGNNEINILTNALNRFPSLSGIEISNASPVHKHLYFGDRGIPKLESLGSEAREILQERDEWVNSNDPGLRFWSLYRAAVMAHRAEQFEEIRGYALDIEGWGREWGWQCDAFGPEHYKLTALKSLTLEFNYGFWNDGFYSDGSVNEETVQLGNFLIQSTLLESLHLSFEIDEQRAIWDEMFKLGALFTKKTHWEHLKSLSLKAVAVSGELLRSILYNHTLTLRELELSDIQLEKSSPQAVLGPECWVNLMIFLHKSMSLSKVKFYGRLDTSDYNGWITGQKPPTTNADGSYSFATDSESCFRRRIERYITHQGPFPFIACPGGFRGLTWAFEDDDSCYLDVCVRRDN